MVLPPFCSPSLQSPSWGFFERPKNMSAAFGGGQAIPLGGVDLKGDSEWDQKYQDMLVSRGLLVYRGNTRSIRMCICW
jgi:hypothetical protein